MNNALNVSKPWQIQIDRVLRLLLVFERKARTTVVVHNCLGSFNDGWPANPCIVQCSGASSILLLQLGSSTVSRLKNICICSCACWGRRRWQTGSFLSVLIQKINKFDIPDARFLHKRMYLAFLCCFSQWLALGQRCLKLSYLVPAVFWPRPNSIRTHCNTLEPEWLTIYLLWRCCVSWGLLRFTKETEPRSGTFPPAWRFSWVPLLVLSIALKVLPMERFKARLLQ